MDDLEPTIELSYAGSRLTLTRVSKLPPGNPGAGDFELLVRVESYGFTGEHQVWIDAEDWSRFQSRLRELEERRQGEAHVRSMSPEEFDLTIRAVDRAGHIGVFGCLARYTLTHGRTYSYLPSVRFAFEVCPSLLPAFVRACDAISLD